METPTMPPNQKDPLDMTGELDNLYAACGGFTRPPIVLSPTASRDDLIAVAASRAWSLFELVAFMLGDQRDDRTAGDAAELLYAPVADLAHILETITLWSRLGRTPN